MWIHTKKKKNHYEPFHMQQLAVRSANMWHITLKSFIMIAVNF